MCSSDLEAAMNAGSTAGDGESLTNAALAGVAWASMRDAPCRDCLKRVEDIARRAMDADNGNPRAYVALVMVIAFESRLVGTRASSRAHYPEQAKAALDAALKFAPNDSWALAALGGLHIEVVRSAGRVVAGFLYDAHFDTGVAYFKRALAAEPGDPVVQLNYALSLSSYAFNNQCGEIETALAAAARATPRDAYAAAMKMRAQQLLDLLRADKRVEYLALSSRYLGFPSASAF